MSRRQTLLPYWSQVSELTIQRYRPFWLPWSFDPSSLEHLNEDTADPGYLIALKALPTVDLGALHAAHGLSYAGGKVYFTAETNKVIGRYDSLTRKIDWVIGLGQTRTHTLVVSKDLKKIFTSNINSDTISFIRPLAKVGR